MSNMRGYRKNTLVIDFTVLPDKPSVLEIRKFIFECLKLDIKQIQNIQLLIQQSFAYIELTPEFPAADVVNEFSRKFCMTTEKGLQKPIPLFLADGAVEIKIFDLPPYLPNAKIANTLTAYGEVLSIKDESWHDFFPGVANGTRVARMILKKPIPSYLAIEDMTAFIRYRNQTPTCKHCARHLHIGQKCSEIKKALDNGASSGLTAADVLRGVNPRNKPAETNQSTVPAQTVPPATIPEISPPKPHIDLEEDAEGNSDAQSVTSEDQENVSITEDEEMAPENTEDVVEATPVTSDATGQKLNLRSLSKPREGWKTATGKRPGSPKDTSGKRPSRSSSRK